MIYSLQVLAIPATRMRPTPRQALQLQTIPRLRATPPSDQRHRLPMALPRPPPPLPPPPPDRSLLLRPRQRTRRSRWSLATRSRRRARPLRRERRRRRPPQILSETMLNAPTSRTLPHSTHSRAHFKLNQNPQERTDSKDQTHMVSRNSPSSTLMKLAYYFQVLKLICAPAS